MRFSVPRVSVSGRFRIQGVSRCLESIPEISISSQSQFFRCLNFFDLDFFDRFRVSSIFRLKAMSKCTPEVYQNFGTLRRIYVEHLAFDVEPTSWGWHLLSAATAECGKVLPSMVQDGGTWAWHGKHGLETTLDYSTTYETVMFAGLRIYDLVSM